MYLSYLTIRDIRNTNPNNKLNQYKSNFQGGYGSVYWDFGYDDVINKIELTFFDALLESNVQMRAEFYEYREQMGKIEYAFINTYNNENCVELYSNSELVGKVFYSSDIKITEDWLVDFLNENLVVINVKNNVFENNQTYAQSDSTMFKNHPKKGEKSFEKYFTYW